MLETILHGQFSFTRELVFESHIALSLDLAISYYALQELVTCYFGSSSSQFYSAHTGAFVKLACFWEVLS